MLLMTLYPIARRGERGGRLSCAASCTCRKLAASTSLCRFFSLLQAIEKASLAPPGYGDGSER
eukprot:scaffold305814_cov30-Tisochrysis_lutea.AAC.3